ncbi:phosphate signaling complex protein PhoU [Actinomycetaceae bacterium WB03_NA08]|uniref:Phosphate-specific transport system accessory protein PhoU n=1 Tax=Scrofimicrobium canadense TaxID=2652290 RepID=A0A6N7VQ59_9ACTO|nr:phosphate signaling complex protein PhoU [Scrofimicrobium canadense]MSS83889.1 phosphate signaling complex protein PhoU [Scrofimicrobium canadense]
MRDAFQEELEETRQRLVELAELIEKAITGATEAFHNSDLNLAEAIVKGDQIIDEKATELDEFVLDILVRQQPVASDLRLMISAMRIGGHLERMGDLAEHIALFARYRFPDSVVPRSLERPFSKMRQLDVDAATAVVALLKSFDLTFAAQIREMDDEIDALHAGIFAQVLDRDFEGDATVVVDATLASRYHERFGDHAVSITDNVLYLVSGERAGDA